MLPRGSTLIHDQGQVKNHGQQAFHTVPVVGFEPLLGSMQLSKEKNVRVNMLVKTTCQRAKISYCVSSNMAGLKSCMNSCEAGRGD